MKWMKQNTDFLNDDGAKAMTTFCGLLKYTDEESEQSSSLRKNSRGK